MLLSCVNCLSPTSRCGRNCVSQNLMGPTIIENSCGFFCCIVPTFNQVEDLLIAMRQGRFAFIEVCEILLRYFKPEPARIRPTDRMVAHTGFIIVARRTAEVRQRWRNRKRMAEISVPAWPMPIRSIRRCP